MPIDFKIEVLSDHVLCTTSGEFSPQEGLRFLNTVADACEISGLMYALVDVTGITQPHMATEKLIWAYNVDNAVALLSQLNRMIPRTAIFGMAPFISTYKPASDHFQRRNIPIRVFDNKAAAKEWLFATTIE